jgi:cytochrome o ubiquinol oxidase operon protein cyoD
MEHGHHEHHAETSHSSYKSYFIGFVLSVILTAIPFGLVMLKTFSTEITILCVLVAAAVQVIVHLHYFLHMDRSPEQRETVLSFVFTAIILAIIIGGSMWIMANLSHYTMIMGN